MKYIDYFFNSYPKRIACIVTIILSFYIYTLTQDYISGYYLNTVQSIEDLISFIDIPVIYNTFLGRFVIHYLEGIDSVFTMVMKAVGLTGLISIFFYIILLCSDISRRHRYTKIGLFLIAIIFIVEYALILRYGTNALMAVDTILAISALHSVAVLLKFFSILQIILSIALIVCAWYCTLSQNGN